MEVKEIDKSSAEVKKKKKKRMGLGVPLHLGDRKRKCCQ